MNNYQRKILELSSTKNLGKLTLREIGELIGLKPPHPQAVKYHLEQLKKRGLILINFEKNLIKRIRSGKVNDSNLIALPILGSANCGPATIFADECIAGFLKVSPRILDKEVLNRKDKIFILEAEGNSMNRAEIGQAKLSIEDGDYVVIDNSNRNPKNSDYVLSVIDNMANIKKFVFEKENNRISLISKSTENYPPIFIRPDESYNYMINGVVLQVIKKSKS